MCGDDAPGLVLKETMEHSLSNCRADLRFCTTANLVYQDETLLVREFHHVLHVKQMAGIRAQFVFNALFVTDVQKDVVEYTYF